VRGEWSGAAAPLAARDDRRYGEISALPKQYPKPEERDDAFGIG